MPKPTHSHHPPPPQRPYHHPPPPHHPNQHPPPPPYHPNHHHHPPPQRQQNYPNQHHPPPQRQQNHPNQHLPPPPQRQQTKPPKSSHTHHPPPPPQPPQQQPLPPRYRPTKPPKPRRTMLASCIVATVFLLFIIILIFIIYFSLFKAKDPKINVTAVQLPTFTVSTNSTTVSFTFSQYAAVNNPNRAVFSHFDSTLQLLYAGNQVGFMFIPAGKIRAGKTEYMAATFSVNSFPMMSPGASAPPEVDGIDGVPAMFLPPVTDGVDRVRPTMELESRLEMVGRVRVLWFFTHHVEAVSDCRVDVAINDGSVLGFHC